LKASDLQVVGVSSISRTAFNEQVTHFANEHCTATAKQDKWGTGFRNRREIVRKTLSNLGLSQELLNQVFRDNCLSRNLHQTRVSFSAENTTRPQYYKVPFSEVAQFWRERWLLPRADRDASFGAFQSEMYRLWRKLRVNSSKNPAR